MSTVCRYVRMPVILTVTVHANYLCSLARLLEWLQTSVQLHGVLAAQAANAQLHANFPGLYSC